MLKKIIFLSYLLCVNKIFSAWSPHDPKQRLGSSPYISGDDFRGLCDFFLDDTHQPFDPEKVKKGDLIFVRTELPVVNVRKFFKEYHPKIKEKYILITHNGDDPAPGHFKKYLYDKKLFAWFGQNADIENHPKFIPIPIGIENRIWRRNYVEFLKFFTDKSNYAFHQKTNLLYVNFNPLTSPKIREPIAQYFKSINFCRYAVGSHKSLLEYFKDVCCSKFILSPPGNGLDCIRTWEALYLGVIPIVLSSTLDKLLENLPVLVINNWSELNVEFLEKKYIEMKPKKYDLEKLHFDYWKNLIMKYKTQCINS